MGFLDFNNPVRNRTLMLCFVLHLMLYLLISCDFVVSKECTNAFLPTLSSHTLRYELQITNNRTWVNEMFSLYYLDHSSPWANVIPGKVLRGDDELGWNSMREKMLGSSGFRVPHSLLKELSLHNVRLDRDSIHGRAQQTNLDYLLMLDVDRLVWSFRKTANLPTPGAPYGGWEAPNIDIRGHFVG